MELSLYRPQVESKWFTQSDKKRKYYFLFLDMLELRGHSNLCFLNRLKVEKVEIKSDNCFNF